MKTGDDEDGYIFTNQILAGFEWNISRTALYNNKYIQRLVAYIYFYILYFFYLFRNDGVCVVEFKENLQIGTYKIR